MRARRKRCAAQRLRKPGFAGAGADARDGGLGFAGLAVGGVGAGGGGSVAAAVSAGRVSAPSPRQPAHHLFIGSDKQSLVLTGQLVKAETNK